MYDGYVLTNAVSVFSFAPRPKAIHAPSFSASCFKLHKTLVLVLNPKIIFSNQRGYRTGVTNYLTPADFNELFL